MQQRRPIRFEAIESEYAEMATPPAARSVPHDKRQRQGGRCRQLGPNQRGHRADTVNVEHLTRSCIMNGPNKWPKTARQLVNLHKFVVDFSSMCGF